MTSWCDSARLHSSCRCTSVVQAWEHRTGKRTEAQVNGPATLHCRNTKGWRNVLIYRMPFCSKCGNQVDAADRFCARCGSPQPVTAGPQHTRPVDPLSGISSRTASILCYIPVVGWVPAIVILAAQRFRNDRAVRFHAFQGLYLFVAWL